MSTTKRAVLFVLLAGLLLPACRSGGSQTAAVRNRDPLGEPDVARYIERLQAPDRLENLQVARVVESLPLRADAVVGDLGCGPGIFALAIANACPRGIVYASDVEPAQLDRVREHVAATGLRHIVPVLASADDPHFPPGRLDLVFVGDTYHHLPDRVAYLRRLATTLKPGAILAILEYKPGPLPVGPPPDHKLPAGVRERELEAAGYVLVERFATHPYHDFELWRLGESWDPATR